MERGSVEIGCEWREEWPRVQVRDVGTLLKLTGAGCGGSQEDGGLGMGGSSERDLEHRRTKNRESAKRSRWLWKLRWEQLQTHQERQNQTLEELNRVLELQQRSLRILEEGAVGGMGSLGSLNRSKELEGIEGLLKTERSDRARRAGAAGTSYFAVEPSEMQTVDAENSLYWRLLSPERKLASDLSLLQEDFDRSPMELTSPLQKMNGMVHLFVLNSQGVVTAVRYRDINISSSFNSEAMTRHPVWETLHTHDAPNVKKVVQQCLSQDGMPETSGAFILSYRRKLANRDQLGSSLIDDLPEYIRLKAVLEPILDANQKRIAVLFAEFGG